MAEEPDIKGRTNESRKHQLARMLEDRRRVLAMAVQGRIRDTRADTRRRREVLDSGESSEVDVQDDIEFALLQMKTETLNQIDAALRRLEKDTYGDCDQCGREIAEARLLALPFAVRCKDCEEAREAIDQRERSLAQRRGALGLFLDVRA